MDKPTEADLAKTLEGLSAAATQGELIIPQRDHVTDRTSAYVSEIEPSVFMACMGKPTTRREADTAFLVTLWNAYRTGQLIVVDHPQATSPVDDRETPNMSDKQEIARLREALTHYAADYDHRRKCSQWDGGAIARQALGDEA